MTGKEIIEELERNYGWNFQNTGEQYHSIFEDIQKVILRQAILCHHKNITSSDGLNECLDCGIRNF